MKRRRRRRDTGVRVNANFWYAEYYCYGDLYYLSEERGVGGRGRYEVKEVLRKGRTGRF